MKEKRIKIYFTGTFIPEHLVSVAEVFEKNSNYFDSEVFTEKIESNYVLEKVRKNLEDLNFNVETGKKEDEKIIFKIPTKTFGEIVFHADAYNKNTKTIIEVEAGRAVINNQFLKDIYQASAIENCDYLVLAVKKKYRKTGKDFEKVSKFVDGLFPNPLLKIKGIMVIGY